MKNKIEEFNKKNVKLSIEEQIKLEQEYKEYIIINNRFNKFIDYVITNIGKLPNTTSKNEQEKSLANLKNSIRTFHKKEKRFGTSLSKEKLQYLYNSEYESLRELYNAIMKKAYSVNYQEYIDIDNEIRNNNRKGRVA